MYRLCIAIGSAALLHSIVVVAEGNDAIYERVKHSTVWITNPDQGGGSGVLVDKKRRLVVTNAHVVEDQEHVFVFPPLRNPQGEEWKREWYLADTERLVQLGCAASGRVVAFSSTKDLALLCLDQDIEHLSEIAFADELPKPGDHLHICGNPTDRPLFSYAFGSTRTTMRSQWTYSGGQSVDADVIYINGPTWFGNSGGPVANDEGKLVGVITGSGKTMATAIDFREIRRLLSTVGSRNAMSVLNRTDLAVPFTTQTDGTGNWKSHILQPDEMLTWVLADEKITISFDHAFKDGYQDRRYILPPYPALIGEGGRSSTADGKQYVFRRVRGGLNLFSEN